MYKILLASLLLSACAVQQPSVAPPEKSNLVYHIQPDQSLDDPLFTVCDLNTAFAYYGYDTHTKRDKRELINYFTQGYHTPDGISDTGYVTIRFMVNCMGVPGRFRVLTFDNDYQEIVFSNEVTSQLLALTKNVKDWQPIMYNNTTRDSYCYFLFKINNGKLIDILP
jgi:hypothetical protein